MPFSCSRPAGWCQYFTRDIYFLTVAIGSGIVATVSTLSGQPVVSLFAGAASSLMFNTFILTSLRGIRAETDPLEMTLRDKYRGNSKEKRMALQAAEKTVGSFGLAKIFMSSSVVVSTASLLAVAAQLGIAIKIVRDGDSFAELTSPKAMLPLTLANSASLLVGFVVLNILGARVPKLKEQAAATALVQRASAGLNPAITRQSLRSADTEEATAADPLLSPPVPMTPIPKRK